MNKANQGFTFIELIISLAMASVIILGLSGVIGETLHSQSSVHTKVTINRDAYFAMQQITEAVNQSHHLLLPLNDNPTTNWPENIREQTIPPSPPIGTSTLSTAVLAVTLAYDIDLDNNGTFDADNDGDGRFDEDLGADNNNDAAAGISQIDDNGDGSIDNSSASTPAHDNDEDNATNEDPLNDLDDDFDGTIDEDSPADTNADGQEGIADVDDDSDGSIDEGSTNDDDEDGSSDEDGYDAVVFYLVGNQLIKRTPVPWDVNSDSQITGADFITSVIAENVTHFRVERLLSIQSIQLLDITLALTSPNNNETINLNTLIRLGGAL